ncbi:MAG: ppk, partial [Acidimicrobiales bacterium]|nr:ppk [Acidimicrobiales bacterium]
MLDERQLNRELSWLDFNRRVLSLAGEQGIPLLERVKFIAIFSSNLDEFFQVRVAALHDQVAADLTLAGADGRTPGQLLQTIGEVVRELIDIQETIVRKELRPMLLDHGIDVVGWEDLTVVERDWVVEVFRERIFPVLTPLAVDPAHPFPYISNLAISLAAMVSDPSTGERRFARLKVPSILPRLVPLPGGDRFVPLEQVIAAHLHTLFIGMEVEEVAAFRITRNADLTVEDEDADDLLAAVELELRRRRFGKAVRLEVDASMSQEMLELLMRELELEPDAVTSHHELLDLTCFFALNALDRPALKDTQWPPVTAGRILTAEEADRSLFSVIRERALLVHHPYESFASSAEAFLSEAASDPRVQSIKMTLYRTSGDSPIARSLIRAAERGVQVAVLVELKARFDEATNVTWAKTLERAGVHVVYGLVGLKTHAKCVLVVRSDSDGLRRYVHLGTGNYNSRTARLYEDLGYITCDPAIGEDATQLFNHLTGYSRDNEYKSLVVAPHHLRTRLLALIANESKHGANGGITIKTNSIGDPEMIEALYAASAAGVSIDLLVRGICCIRAGVPGLSENIRIRSVLGRYLEHSRIYRFANGAEIGGGHPSTPHFLIGSADLMPRNLDRRVETLVPVAHPKHQAWLDQVLEVQLADDIVAFDLQPDNTWLRVGPLDAFEPHSQERMYHWVTAK